MTNDYRTVEKFLVIWEKNWSPRGKNPQAIHPLIRAEVSNHFINIIGCETINFTYSRLHIKQLSKTINFPRLLRWHFKILQILLNIQRVELHTTHLPPDESQVPSHHSPLISLD